MFTDEKGASQESEIPIATLLSAKDIDLPDVQAWQLSSFKIEAPKDIEQIHQDVLAQWRQEAAFEIEKQAEAIKKSAYDEGHKEGFDAGFAQGVQEGKEAGHDQAQEEAKQLIQPQIEQFSNVIAALQHPFQLISNEVYSSIVMLATELAQKIVETEITLQPSSVLSAVQQSIEVLPDDSEAVVVELHPEDLAIIDAFRQEYNKDWVIRASENVVRGGCRVKHGASTVDNNWQKKMATILSQTLEIAQSQTKTNQTESTLPDKSV